MSFSKKDLNFDFFSKISELIITVKSLRFFEFKISIIFKILSVALLIIIIFSWSNSDFDKILSIKLFSLSKISFSS